jgi:hypothetical protein
VVAVCNPRPWARFLFAHRMMRLWPGDGWSILNTGRPFSTTAVRAMTCCKLVTSSDTSPDHLRGGPRVGEMARSRNQGTVISQERGTPTSRTSPSAKRLLPRAFRWQYLPLDDSTFGSGRSEWPGRMGDCHFGAKSDRSSFFAGQ